MASTISTLPMGDLKYSAEVCDDAEDYDKDNEVIISGICARIDWVTEYFIA